MQRHTANGLRASGSQHCSGGSAPGRRRCVWIPKGAMLSHRNLLANCTQMRHWQVEVAIGSALIWKIKGIR